ncbi:MAG: penicillin binding protein transpeptidase protein [Neobacillus sp.]|jgi:beta-lactamase class D|nr:penicillin binding protein transpeptidase protein [Neobacillus sp.]
MILRITLLIIVAAFYVSGVNGQTKGIFSKGTRIVMPNIQRYFKECGVRGTIAIYDNVNDIWFVSDTSDSKIERVPASTFKIINMLIALETNTIKDENAVVKWPGLIDTIKYGYRPDIYRDIAVKEAFQVSAGWAFIELAKKIDRSTYQKFLRESGYGNVDLTEKGEDFWNFGAMSISPINQIEFLKRLYDGNLPFSNRNMNIVKEVMITEKEKDYLIRSKTGWTMEHNTNTGWWVGYLESGKNVYFFATRLIQDRKFNRSDFSSCRKEITKKVFRDLKIMQ